LAEAIISIVFNAIQDYTIHFVLWTEPIG